MSKIDLTKITAEEADSALRLARVLTDQAARLVRGSPFNKWLENDDGMYCLLEIEGEKATLYWEECNCGSDASREVEDEFCAFPTRLLFATDDDIQQMRAEAEREVKRKDELRSMQAKARNEAKERLELARLKAKYGN